MRKTCCIVILCFFYAAAAAQSVAVINGKPVDLKEFMWVYQKHRPGPGKTTLTQLISFLNIYVDFKLKVLDACNLQLDKDSTYLAEIKNYETAFVASLPADLQKRDHSLVINEYKEALLLFNISERKIWDIMADSESGIHNYYTSNVAVYDSKPYDEVKSDVAADYQQQLECNWVTALRNKYKVTIDQTALQRLIR